MQTKIEINNAQEFLFEGAESLEVTIEGSLKSLTSDYSELLRELMRQPKHDIETVFKNCLLMKEFMQFQVKIGRLKDLNEVPALYMKLGIYEYVINQAMQNKSYDVEGFYRIIQVCNGNAGEKRIEVNNN